MDGARALPLFGPKYTKKQETPPDMRATIYDTFGLGLLLGSTFFFYQTISFLAQKDYVSGVIAMAIGFLVIRVGVEVSKLAILIRREDHD